MTSPSTRLPHVHIERLDQELVHQVIQAVLSVQKLFPRGASNSEAAAAGAMIAAVSIYQVGELPLEHAHKLLDLCWELALKA